MLGVTDLMCRLCLNSCEFLIHIFEPIGNDGFQLWKVIIELLRVNVSEDDELPPNVCKKCMQKLKDFNDFKSMCIGSLSTLRGIIINEALIKVEDVEHIDHDVEIERTFIDNDSIEIPKCEVSPTNSEFEWTPESVNGLVAHKERVTELSGDNVDREPIEDEGWLGHCGKTIKGGDDLEKQRDISHSQDNKAHQTNKSTATQTRSLQANKATPTRQQCTSTSETSNAVRMKTRLRSCSHNNQVKATTDDINSNDSSVTSRREVGPGNETLNLDGGRKPRSKLRSSELLGEVSAVPSARGDKWEGQDFQCNDCGRVFGSKGSISRHVKVHLGVGVFHSCICSIKFTEKNEYEMHNSAKHGRRTSEMRLQNVVAVAGSGEQDTQGKGLTKSKKHSGQCCDAEVDQWNDGQSKFTCGVCNEVFPQRKDFRLHVRTHLDVLYSCLICSKEFAQKVHLKSHIKSAHLKEHNFLCDICGRTFSSEEGLCTHMNSHKGDARGCCQGGFTTKHERLEINVHLSHEGEKSYACNVCFKTFSRKDVAKRHMTVHSQERPHSCKLCEKAFIQKGALKEHMVVHSRVSPHMCHVCKKTFTQRGSLNRHMVVHSKIRPYSCDICQKTFNLKTSLQQHLAIHSNERAHSCHICQRAFNLKISLRQHMVVHTNERPHCCSVCNKRFSQRGSLKRHMVVHMSEWPHACDICNKTFSQKAHLQQHMVVHTRERPYSCDVCSKAFGLKHSLMGHMETHRTVKPFSCDECSKTFRVKRLLRLHMKIHSGIKPYACDKCPKAFIQKGNLRRHMAVHTSNKQLEC